MSKEIVSHETVRAKLQAGVDKIADTVKITLGPKGRNVFIQNTSGAPSVTSDGAAIAKAIELEDPIEDLGAQLIRQVSARTNDAVGDGTTTATLLAQTIIREGLRNMAAGASPVELRRGIQGAAQVAAAALQKLARPVEGRTAIAQAAAIAAGEQQAGELIADALTRVGRDGVVTVEESSGMETVLEVMDGMQFDRGLLSPHFCTNPELQTADLDHPLILVTDLKITNLPDLVPLLEDVMEEDRVLLIIAEELSEEVLGTLVMNKLQGVLKVAAVRPPAYGDGRRAIMEDIALMTGAVYVTESLGHTIKGVTIDMLGSAGSVRVEKNRTTIVRGEGDPAAIASRVAELRLLSDKIEYDFEKKRTQERLARLAGGIAVLHVGAPTEAEIKERTVRIEDGLHAAKAAVAEGVVPGGGVALLDTAPAVRAYRDSLAGDQKTGASILLRALEAPAGQIAANAGLESSTVVLHIMQQPAGTGLDVMSERYVDMISAGIVDPARVTRVALLSAASLSAALLTTEAALGEKEAAAPQPGQ